MEGKKRNNPNWKNVLSFSLAFLMLIQVPMQAFGYMVPGAKTITESTGDTKIVDKDGKEIDAKDESWEEKFPYGAFAFENSSLSVKEGENGAIKVYRLGGTTGRATAYITYEPTLIEGEDGEIVYDYGLSAEDLNILVEEPQPVAKYQPIGKKPDPLTTASGIVAVVDGEGYVIKTEATADSYRWQVYNDGVWKDVIDSNVQEVPIAKEDLENVEYDFRCILTVNGVEYCTTSYRGVAYERPKEEKIEPMPSDIELNAKPVYTPLDLKNAVNEQTGEKNPYSGMIFELIFAEGEWVKEIHIEGLIDDKAEAREAGAFTIVECKGGDVLESMNTLLLSVDDINEAEPSTLGFVISEVKVDKAEGKAEVMIKRVGGNQRPVTIKYETKDGTAKAGKDYEATTGTYMFYGGLREIPVIVQLIDDQVKSEDLLDFTIELSELKGDDKCTLDITKTIVSLFNSGTGDASNLASQLYDSEAVDVIENVETSEEAANADTGAVVGVQQKVEEAETVYATLSSSTDGLSTQGGNDATNGRVGTVNFGGISHWNGNVNGAKYDWRFNGGTGKATGYKEGDTAPKVCTGYNKNTNYYITNGTAFVSRYDISKNDIVFAGFGQIGNGSIENSGEMYSSVKATIQTNMGHDTTKLLKYYSFTLPRLTINDTTYPKFIKRFGWGAGDAQWTIKANDTGGDNENDYYNPYDKAFTVDVEYGGQFKISPHMEYNGTDEREREMLNDASMVWVKHLIFYRRVFTGSFNYEIVTPNDTTDGSTAEITNYDNFIPEISFNGSNGGFDKDGKLYMGSEISVSTKNNLPSNYQLAKVVILDGNGKDVTNKFKEISSNATNYTFKLVSGKDKLSENDTKQNYTIRVIYERTSNITVDITQSVPRGKDGNVDDSRIGEVTSGYKDEKGKLIDTHTFNTSNITYGYSKLDGTKYVETISNSELTDDDSDKVKFKISGENVKNIQWINFNQNPKDLILVNGKAYAGDQKIYLTLADFVGGLNVQYYHENYKSAKNTMTTSISWMEVYYDGNGNGQIDGYYDKENGVFRVSDGDTFVTTIESNESVNEKVFAPVKEADGYHQYFIKVCYNMTPRSLVLPEGASKDDKAQILPVFLSSLKPDKIAYVEQTREQKSYRYIVSGKTRYSSTGDYTRSSDNHLMYGAEANAKSILDIPLGGDYSPAALNDDEKAYVWTPEYHGNMLYPYSAPEPILIKESVVGPVSIAKATTNRDADGAIIGYKYEEAELNKINGYLGSFVGTTTFGLATQEQNYTTDEIFAKVQSGVSLGGGTTNQSYGALYVQGTEEKSYYANPEAVNITNFSTIPDTEYLKSMKDNSASPSSDKGMGDSGSEMPEFNTDLGINLGSTEIGVTDYVSIITDGNKVGFSVGLSFEKDLGKGAQSETFAEQQKGNWTKFADFFNSTNFGDEGYGNAARASKTRKVLNNSPGARPTPYATPTNGSQFKSMGFSGSISVTLAFMFEYNPLDNGFYFEGMTIAAEFSLTFRLQFRLTVCPIVYVYFQFTGSIGVETGLGVIRKAVDGKAIIDAKAAGSEANAKTIIYMEKPSQKAVISEGTYNDLDNSEKSLYKKDATSGNYYKDNFASYELAREAFLDTKDYTLTVEQYKVLTEEEKKDYQEVIETGGKLSHYINNKYSDDNEAQKAYKEAISYEFETNMKAFNIRFNGKVAIDVYTGNDKDGWKPVADDFGYITGYLSSDGSKDTQVVLKQKDDMELDETVKVVIRPLDHNSNIRKDETKITYLAITESIVNDVYWKGIKLSPSICIEVGAGVGVELFKLELYAKIGLEATFLLGVYNPNYDPTDSSSKKYQPASIESFGFSIGLGIRVVVLMFSFELDVATYKVDYDGKEWTTGWHFLNDYVSGQSANGEDSDSKVTISPPASKAGQQTIYTPEMNAGETDDLSTQAYNPTVENVPFQFSGYGTSVDAVNLSTKMITGSDYQIVNAGDKNYIIYTVSRTEASTSPLDTAKLVMSELTYSGGKYGLVNPAGTTGSNPYIVIDNDDTGDLDFYAWYDKDSKNIRITWISYDTPSTATVENAQEKLKEASKNTVLKSGSWSTTTKGESFTPIVSGTEKGIAGSFNRTTTSAISAATVGNGYMFAPTSIGNGEVVFFGSTAAYDDGDKVYTDYETYTNTKHNAVTSSPGSDQSGVAKYLNTTKKSQLDVFGVVSTLNIAYKANDDIWKTSSVALSSKTGNEFTVSNVEFTKLNDNKYYVAYTTRKEAVDGTTEKIVEERLYLRTVTIDATKTDPVDGVKWGDPYLIRMTKDYDKAKDKDGVYTVNGSTPEIKYDSPYFANLQFITANVDPDLLNAGVSDETFQVQAVGSHTFLLFEMNGTTYTILDESLESITTSGTGKINTFFTGEVHKDEKGNVIKTDTTSGKMEVTIGVDNADNVYAVYTSAVKNTTNNALYISSYDANTNTWGDGVILAMNNLDTYEYSIKDNWNDKFAQAMYYGKFGLSQTLGNDEKRIRDGLLTESIINSVYGEDADMINKAFKQYDTDGLQSAFGNNRNFTFSNIQAVKGSKDDLLVLTQGSLVELGITEYTVDNKKQYAIRPKTKENTKQMDSSLGIYAVSFGKGEQKLGEGNIAFDYSEFSKGSTPYVFVTAKNIGDTAFRGSKDQPITATLTVGEQKVAEWKITTNIKSGQNIELDGYCAAFANDLSKDSKFILKIKEYEEAGTTYTNPTSKELELYTVEEKPDLAVEDLNLSVASIDGENAIVNVEFNVANRGAALAEDVMAQFTYESSIKSDKSTNNINVPQYTVVDLTDHKLDIGKETKLSTQDVSTSDELKKGILKIHNDDDGNNDLKAGYGRKVSGTIKVPLKAFCAGESDCLRLKIQLYSGVDPTTSLTAGVVEVQSNDQNQVDNSVVTDLDSITFYTVAPSIVIPMGKTTLIPVVATNTKVEKSKINAIEIEDLDGYNIGILNFKPTAVTSTNTQSINGVISITPSKLGTGIIELYDAVTKTKTAVTFTVVDSADGIDIYNDNEIFRFFNNNDTPYDKNGTNQNWRFVDGVSEWGQGNDKEIPLRNNYAVGNYGTYFEFDTVAESIDLYFEGNINVTSNDNLDVTLESAGGKIPKQIKLSPNPGNANITTVKVKVLSPYGYFDRMVEHYSGGVVPKPEYDGQSPMFIWSRSFPNTGTVNTETTIPLKLYIIDNNGLKSLTINGVEKLGESDYSKISADNGIVEVYDFGNLSENKNYEIVATDITNNKTETILYVDWFNSNSTPPTDETVDVPLYDTDFYINDEKLTGYTKDVENVSIGFVEDSANTKKTKNTFEVYSFDGKQFTKMETVPTTAAGIEAKFSVNNNGLYWARVLNDSDNDGKSETWSNYIMNLDKIDSNLPKLTASYNSGTKNIYWLAYKELTTAGTSVANINSVTVNGFNIGGIEPSNRVAGYFEVKHNGEYSFTAKDVSDNTNTATVVVSDRTVDLSECTMEVTSNPWYQTLDNGSIKVDLTKIAGGYYNTTSKPAENEYFADYEYALVEGKYDGTQTVSNWIKISTQDFATSTNIAKIEFAGLKPAEYTLVVRDASSGHTGDFKTLSVTLENKKIEATYLVTKEGTFENNAIEVNITNGNTNSYEVALMPVNDYQEGTIPTIVDFLALDTADSNEDDIIWNEIVSQYEFNNLAEGWYYVAVRGMHGATQEDNAKLFADASSDYYKGAVVFAVNTKLASTEKIEATATAVSGKIFNENAIDVDITKGNTNSYEVALMPVKDYKEGTTPTVADFLALDTKESTEDDIAWTETAKQHKFDKLEEGWYYVAIRGMYGASQEYNAKLFVDANSKYYRDAIVIAVYVKAVDPDPVVPTAPQVEGTAIKEIGTNENGATTYILKEPFERLTDEDKKVIIAENANNDVVISTSKFVILLPKGTLVGNFDINVLIVSTDGMTSDSIVAYTDVNGNKKINMWSMVVDGKVMYIVRELGVYELITNSKEFIDIKGLWGEEFIKFVTEREIFEGTGDGMFSPEGTMTRAMFVTVLWRMAGKVKVDGNTDFEDLRADWYKEAVKWAVENNITNGFSSTEFGPDKPVNREQMCVFLVRFMKYLGMELPEENSGKDYADKNGISSWASEFVDICTKTGLVEGVGENNFAPQNSSSRMQVSTLLTRFIKKILQQYCK